MENTAQQAQEILGPLSSQVKEEFSERLEQQGFILEISGLLGSGHDPAKRRQAIKFLSALGARRYKTTLLKALDDPDAQVRVEAIGALATLKDKEIQEAIAALAQDPCESVRTAVGWTKLQLP